MTFLGDHTKNKLSDQLILLSDNFKFKSEKYINNKQQRIIYREYHTGKTSQLGYYIAGLIEGDGSIILRKGKREKISPKIVFTFGKKELKMYEKLQDILKTGSINIEKIDVGRYSITNADAVINLINLINGKFRTPKIIALHKAIDNLNK